MKRWVRFWWLGVTISFFLFYRYLSSLMSFWNRLEIAWTSQDFFQLLFILSVSGGVLMVGGILLNRWAPSTKTRDQIFLLGLFLVLWPLLDALSFPQVLKIAGVIGCGVFIVKPPRPLARVLISLLFICSPVTLIFLGQAYFFKNVANVCGQPPQSIIDPVNKQSPIFFFLFDEWSYGRTFVEGEVKSAHPTFGQLAKESVVFHNAFSPGPETLESVPSLLGTPTTKKGTIFIGDSLFAAAKKKGWTRFIIGSYLPYVFWFENDVNYCLRASTYKKPQGRFIDNTASHLGLAFYNPLHTWNKPLAKYFYNQVAKPIQEARVATVQEAVRNILEMSNSGTFAYFHYSVPHEPFLVLERVYKKRRHPGRCHPERSEGSPAFQKKEILRPYGPQDDSWAFYTRSKKKKNEAENYEANIVLTDQLFAEAVEILKKRGLWEKSLVVVTSDHGWRTDPQLESLIDEGQKYNLLHHVPLFVKMPYQKKQIDDYSVFEIKKLKNLFLLILNEDVSKKTLRYKEGTFLFS